MSSSNKIRGDLALLQAEALRSMLEPFAERWIIAGSIRRQQTLVGDIDHVVIPKFETFSAGGLFGGEPQQANTLWRELDRMIEHKPDTEHEDDFGCTEADYDMTIAKAIRNTEAGMRTCWGNKHRALFFKGATHEIYTTTAEHLGITLAIRTGPADFSRNLVTRLKTIGYPVREGCIWSGTGERARPIPAPTEADVFRIAQWPYVAPEDRR